ncbi:Endodeoxyribonuclease RusA [compost metagenome]
MDFRKMNNNRLIIYETPPTVNHMYENRMSGGRRKRVLTPEARRWMDNAVVLANLWRQKNKWPTAQGKVIVKLWYYFPDNRKRDTHNGLKALLDALEDALIYTNDKYALPWIMDYEVDSKNPRIEIEFEEWKKNG